MKKTIPTITISALLFCAVPANAADGATTAKKKTAAPAPQALTIPKDATANPDGTYTAVDKSGKKWVYMKTPFGVVKNPATEEGAAAQDLSQTKLIDKGATVRFERPGPFGTVAWEKQKTDLTDAERQAFDRQNAKTE